MEFLLVGNGAFQTHARIEERRVERRCRGCYVVVHLWLHVPRPPSSFGRINKTGDAPCDDLIYLPCAGDRGNHFRDADISSSGVSSLEARGIRKEVVILVGKRLPTTRRWTRGGG